MASEQGMMCSVWTMVGEWFKIKKKSTFIMCMSRNHCVGFFIDNVGLKGFEGFFFACVFFF